MLRGDLRGRDIAVLSQGEQCLEQLVLLELLSGAAGALPARRGHAAGALSALPGCLRLQWLIAVDMQKLGHIETKSLDQSDAC